MTWAVMIVSLCNTVKKCPAMSLGIKNLKAIFIKAKFQCHRPALLKGERRMLLRHFDAPLDPIFASSTLCLRILPQCTACRLAQTRVMIVAYRLAKTVTRMTIVVMCSCAFMFECTKPEVDYLRCMDSTAGRQILILALDSQLET
jgi:hypothetical protein